MEPNNILDTFFSLQNPGIIVTIFFFVMGILFFLVKKEIVRPLQTNSKKLEAENLKLKVLFAELDPDPILRVDKYGIIVNMNDPALKLFTEKSLNLKCECLIPDYPKIRGGMDRKSEIVSIDEKHFTVSVKEINHLEFSLVYLHDISDRVKQEQQIIEYQGNLKLLREKLDDANEKEREYIGGELHDHIGNRISIIKISLQKYATNPNNVDLNELYEKIDYLSNEVRGISHQLSPKILKEFGLISALTQLVEEMTKGSSVRGYIKDISYDEEISFKLKLGIYRVCQEALNNILKHSKCSEFEIQIVGEEKLLKVFISDNGIGCSIEKLVQRDKPSLGLLNMKERTEMLNGKFEFDSVVGEGSSVDLEFYVESIEND